MKSELAGVATVLAAAPFMLAAGERVRASDQDPVLLIVAPERLMAVAEEYAAFKRTRLTTECVALEGILRASAGADDAERLKQGLYESWRWTKGGRALRYVLLIGDADVMPVRYMVLDRNTEAAFNYAFYPSDLYYADVAKKDGSFEDWNGKKEGFHTGYFGEVRGEHFKDDPINFDGIDYRPEVAVGRWPVSTPEEARIVAEKSMAYERAMAEYRSTGGPGQVGAPAGRSADPAPGTPPGLSDVRAFVTPPRVGLVATGGWMENRPAMDAMAARLAPKWWIEKRYWEGGGREEKTAPPDEAQVLELLNGGASLVLHSGHGSDDRWDGSIGVGSIARMTNRERPTMMMSAGCSTARLAVLPPYEGYVDVDGREHAGTNNGEVFTGPPPPPACYQKGKHNPTGLGEQLLRAGPAGAVVYIGCNTGSQPCGMTLMEGFVDGIAGGERRVGDCWTRAVRYYWEKEGLAEIKPTESWYPASIFFQGMKFMVFGDPSLEIRGGAQR